MGRAAPQQPRGVLDLYVDMYLAYTGQYGRYAALNLNSMAGCSDVSANGWQSGLAGWLASIEVVFLSSDWIHA